MPHVNERDVDCVGDYYTDEQVAEVLGISLGRLRNKLCAGNPLPPRIEPPGCRHRLWPCEALHDWLAQFTIAGVVESPFARERRRRGRPNKKEDRSRNR